ncbi:MAG: YcaO-like family protein [Candidatus Acidiferrales bacterium]
MWNPEDSQFYDQEQISRPAFPFRSYSSDHPLGWVEVLDLTSGKPVLAPAQLLVVGYMLRVDEGEKRLNMAVTTGTAAHTDPEKALTSAVLELIQMDTAMGYWYSDRTAPAIVLDDRMCLLQTILTDTATQNAYEIRFHYLSSPDFPVHVVACILLNRHAEIPACAVGIACDFGLQMACYKAFLEASAIPHLALIGIMRSPQLEKIDPFKITDLDTNVVYYAHPENRATLEKQFPRETTVRAAELPRFSKSFREGLRSVLNVFRDAAMPLYFIDLTTRDIRDLGFCVYRVFSPDLLTLCFPSFPAKAHRRFVAYGGVKHEHPHPYP